MVVRLVFLFVSLPFGLMYDHKAHVAEKIWHQKCDKNSKVLNDCNWCTCGHQSMYQCDARVCSQVDMFGHFNDAIQELHLGMEGHGSWRSTITPCEPNVSYQKKDLLCMCNEDGNWPNPICKDAFKVLHRVEFVSDLQVTVGTRCQPSKLYLVDCNVCLCPSTGQISPKYCTKRICTEDDPVYREPSETYEAEEVYAECKPNQMYKLGCKTCMCIKNHRLLCNDCSKESYCSDKKVGDSFNIDCNICHCDVKGLLYCTVKHCIKSEKRAQIVGGDYELTSQPEDDLECTPGTKYRKGCNTCYCFLNNNKKKFACTMEQCPKSKANECVEGTSYRVDCLQCQCGRLNGVKMEICEIDTKCFTHNARTFNDLASLRGYCEPLHIYRNDCNICECLQDGKTVKCTTEFCEEEVKQKPISVDMIPVVQELTGCPKGQSYKIDCNYCFCLANGNALCTTLKCN